MKITQTQQNNDDVMFVMIAVVYILSILFFQLTLEILKWLFNPNKFSLLLRSDTPQSEKKRAVSNSLPNRTSKMKCASQKTTQKPVAPAQATSTVTNKECFVAFGSLQDVTTDTKLTTSPDGTMSQPLKTSKSLPLTQPARRRRATTLNQTM
jgi:hypothetical protein